MNSITSDIYIDTINNKPTQGEIDQALNKLAKDKDQAFPPTKKELKSRVEALRELKNKKDNKKFKENDFIDVFNSYDGSNDITRFLIVKRTKKTVMIKKVKSFFYGMANGMTDYSDEKPIRKKVSDNTYKDRSYESISIDRIYYLTSDEKNKDMISITQLKLKYGYEADKYANNLKKWWYSRFVKNFNLKKGLFEILEDKRLESVDNYQRLKKVGDEYKLKIQKEKVEESKLKFKKIELKEQIEWKYEEIKKLQDELKLLENKD